MRVLHVQNNHRFGGGSDLVASTTVDLLNARGHQVECFLRDSRTLGGGIRGKVRAFACGLYSRSACREFERALQSFAPDVVHAHELYPLITPWIFRTCRQLGVPSVLTCHDYRQTCPAYTHLRGTRICEACLRWSEAACVFHNCCGSLAVSTAYASRNAVARLARLYELVDVFIAPSHFVRSWLMTKRAAAGSKIVVVGNPVPPLPHHKAYSWAARTDVGFLGRLSHEKGLEVFLRAASLTDLPFLVAGAGADDRTRHWPRNVRYLGPVHGEGLEYFYSRIRLLVIPSLWFENFPMVLLEARSRGIPVVSSAIGALTEMTIDGLNGVLFPPGDAESLARTIRELWDGRDKCHAISAEGQRFTQQFSPEAYYQRLIAVYQYARSGCQQDPLKLAHYRRAT